MQTISQLKDYAATRFSLIKYMAIKKGTAVAANLVADLILVLCLLIAFLFAGIMLAFFMADVLGTNWAGFATAALFYLFISASVTIFKGRIEHMIRNVLIRRLLR